jgi:disulfide bond formation protein DsbB
MSALYAFALLANAWVLLAILAAAFIAQFAAGEPPCPLCVMQRIAMMMAALGPCYTLLMAQREGLSQRAIAIGAGIGILASLLGAAISIRQVLLHILPGDPGFGSPMFGYHLYTWAAIAFACNIAAAGMQLLGLQWFSGSAAFRPPMVRLTAMALGVMLVANILSVIAEAGFAWHLPDNPTAYLLFSR